MSHPTYYRCGICDHYHSAWWDGDCREDDARFTFDDIQARHTEWSEIDMDDVDEWRSWQRKDVPDA